MSIQDHVETFLNRECRFDNEEATKAKELYIIFNETDSVKISYTAFRQVIEELRIYRGLKILLIRPRGCYMVAGIAKRKPVVGLNIVDESSESVKRLVVSS